MFIYKAQNLLLRFPAVYQPGPVVSAQPTPASIQWVASLYVRMRQNVLLVSQLVVYQVCDV